MSTAVASSPSPSLSSPIDSLAEALLLERRLLDALSIVVRRQRTAVATDDLDAVGDCVFATHRMLVTLREARSHRRTIGALIGLPGGVGSDGGTDSLERALGARMTPAIRAARDELHAAARALAREVAASRNRVASS
ncbi:MAG TPA: hypothetical protein VGQ44_04430 [Gemmatimonadaceae bacterium]|jgi:hypothetical protein|nr:hypothetical protein [Gemmatimonadaceae bacterium]